MADYQLVTDATCDMNPDILDRYHIRVLPMEVTMDDGRHFLHYPDFRNFSAKDFYRELGKDLSNSAAWLEEYKLRIAHLFTVGDLFLLHKGERVGAATAVVGTMLNIKPMLIVDETGKLAVTDKVRGRRASIQKLLDMTLKTIQSPEKQTLYIGQADCMDDALYCMDDALYLKKLVKEKLPCKEIVIAGIGPVIGTHTGPSHLCLLSWGSGRRP